MKANSIKVHPQDSKAAKATTKETGQLAVDVYSSKNAIVILAPVAGVQEKDLELAINKDVLVIKGIRQIPESIKEEQYFTNECFWGPFSRAIVLPENTDISKIEASFDNAVLKIIIPQTSETLGAQIIKIKAK